MNYPYVEDEDFKTAKEMIEKTRNFRNFNNKKAKTDEERLREIQESYRTLVDILGAIGLSEYDATKTIIACLVSRSIQGISISNPLIAAIFKYVQFSRVPTLYLEYEMDLIEKTLFRLRINQVNIKDLRYSFSVMFNNLFKKVREELYQPRFRMSYRLIMLSMLIYTNYRGKTIFDIGDEYTSTEIILRILYISRVLGINIERAIEITYDLIGIKEFYSIDVQKRVELWYMLSDYATLVLFGNTNTEINKMQELEKTLGNIFTKDEQNIFAYEKYVFEQLIKKKKELRETENESKIVIG